MRLTHYPTSIVVTATEERSQHLNRKVAWERLYSKVSEITESNNHYENNEIRSSFFNDSPTFIWTEWRNEIKFNNGIKANMQKVLKGDFSKLIKGY